MPEIQDKYSQQGFVNAEALLSFDGVDDEVNLGRIPVITDTSDFSIELIFQNNKVSGISTLISAWQFSNQPNGFSVYTNNGQLESVFRASSGGAITGISYEDGAVTHLVLSMSSNNVSMYVNGVFQGSVGTPQVWDNELDVYIGSNQRVDGNRPLQFLDGSIGLTRIYNKALSQDEVFQVLQNPYAIPSDLHENVVGEWIPQRSYVRGFTEIETTGTSAGWGEIYFNSNERIEGDGSVEFEWSNIDVNICTGISTIDTVTDRLQLEYSFQTVGGLIYWRETTSTASTGVIWSSGTRMKIERVGTEIRYYINDVLVRTQSTGVPSTPLFFNGAFNDNADLVDLNNVRLNQRGITLNSTTALIAIKEQKYLWFDSVEQYNYSKGSPLTANHGVLTGWSDVELLGTSKDFYRKEDLLRFAQLNIIHSTGTTKPYIGVDDSNYDSSYDFGTDDFTINAKIKFTGSLSSKEVRFFSVKSSSILYALEINNVSETGIGVEKGINLLIFDGSVTRITTASAFFSEDRFYDISVICERASTSSISVSDFTFIVDGVEEPVTLTGNTSIGSLSMGSTPNFLFNTNSIPTPDSTRQADEISFRDVSLIVSGSVVAEFVFDHLGVTEVIQGWSSPLEEVRDSTYTEIKTGLPPIEKALEFNGTSEYLEIASYTVGSGFYIAYIDSSGDWQFDDDLTNIPNEDNSGDLRIGKSGSTYFEGYIIGIWDGDDIDAVERVKIKNNTFPRNTSKGNVLNIDMNEESATSGELDEVNGKTVTINHSSPNFVEINTLR